MVFQVLPVSVAVDTAVVEAVETVHVFLLVVPVVVVVGLEKAVAVVLVLASG